MNKNEYPLRKFYPITWKMLTSNSAFGSEKKLPERNNKAEMLTQRQHEFAGRSNLKPPSSLPFPLHPHSFDCHLPHHIGTYLFRDCFPATAVAAAIPPIAPAIAADRGPAAAL